MHSAELGIIALLLCPGLAQGQVVKKIVQAAPKVTQKVTARTTELSRLSQRADRQLRRLQKEERIYELAWKNYQQNQTDHNLRKLEKAKRNYDRAQNFFKQAQYDLMHLSQSVGRSTYTKEFSAPALNSQLLKAASQEGNLEQIKYLVEEKGIDPINVLELSLAHEPVVRYLLDSSDPTFLLMLEKDYFKYAKLAAKQGYAQTVNTLCDSYLLEKEELEELFNLAISKKQFEVADVLIKHQGIRPSSTRLLGALESNNMEGVIFFLEHKVNPNKPMAPTNQTTLMHHMWRLHPEMLPTFIKYGGDINVQDAAGNTLLHTSMFQPDLVETLMSHNIDPTIKNKTGHTPISYAESKMIKAFREELGKEYVPGRTIFFNQVARVSPKEAAALEKSVKIIRAHGYNVTSPMEIQKTVNETILPQRRKDKK